MVDWMASKLLREVVEKRRQRDALTAHLADLDAMLEEARSFEGHYAELIAAAERRVSEVAQGYSPAFPVLVQQGDPAEYRRRLDERDAIIRERDEELARRTTTAQSGPHTLSFCALRSDDIIGRRSRVIGYREQAERELAELEARLTPGQRCEVGVPAPEYVEYVERVEAARAGVLGG